MFRRKKADADLDEEIRAHLEIDRRQRLEAGASPAEANAAARRDFGNVLQVKEVTRQMWRWIGLEQFTQDARYAFRMLLRNPGFALVAALSLGLGIGATAAVFAVFDAVTLRPMALVPEPDRLVRLIPQIKDQRWILMNPIFEGLRDRQQSLAGIFAATDEPFMKVWFEGAAPSYLRGSVVSGAYFRTLGLKPAAGRFLDENDDQLPGASSSGECAAVIGHALWTTRFNSDRATLGRKLRVRETACVVVGIPPRGFAGHQAGYEADLWVPMRQVTPSRSLSNHFGAFYSGVMGRLKPGVPVEVAQAQLTALYQQLQAIEPPPPPNIPDKAIPPQDVNFRLVAGGHGFDAVQREFEQPLQILMILVGVVLLIASANVGGLVLAHGAARAGEFATRAAIGAGRSRLARQLLAEGAVLASLGGAVGIALAFLLARRLASAISLSYMPIALDVAPDLRLLAAACAATACATLLTSMLPAWRLGAVAPGTRSTCGVAAWFGSARPRSGSACAFSLSSRGCRAAGEHSGQALGCQSGIQSRTRRRPRGRARRRRRARVFESRSTAVFDPRRHPRQPVVARTVRRQRPEHARFRPGLSGKQAAHAHRLRLTGILRHHWDGHPAGARVHGGGPRRRAAGGRGQPGLCQIDRPAGNARCSRPREERSFHDRRSGERFQVQRPSRIER